MVANLFVEDCGPVVICLDLRGISNGEQPMHGQLRDKISGIITACCFFMRLACFGSYTVDASVWKYTQMQEDHDTRGWCVEEF